MTLYNVDITAKAKNRKTLCSKLGLIFASALAGAVVFGFGASAQSWVPARCCPSTDCQAAESASVTEVQGGYAIDGVEGIVPYDDPRVQYSQDGKFHSCIRSPAQPNMSQTTAMIAGQKKELKCLFVPLLG